MEEMTQLLTLPCNYNEGDYLCLYLDEDGDIQLQVSESEEDGIVSFSRIVLSDQHALDLANKILQTVYCK